MERSEIPPGTLYMLILKTLARLGPQHGYGIAQFIQQTSEDVLQVEEAGKLRKGVDGRQLANRGLAIRRRGVCEQDQHSNDPHQQRASRDGRRRLRSQETGHRRILPLVPPAWLP